MNHPRQTQFNYTPSPLYPHAIHYRRQTYNKSHDPLISLEQATKARSFTDSRTHDAEQTKHKTPYHEISTTAKRSLGITNAPTDSYTTRAFVPLVTSDHAIAIHSYKPGTERVTEASGKCEGVAPATEAMNWRRCGCCAWGIPWWREGNARRGSVGV